MALLLRRENNQLIETELLRQVLRAQQVLLSADEDCIDRARRHYRNLLDVFTGLIFGKGPSQAARAVRYLRLVRIDSRWRILANRKRDGYAHGAENKSGGIVTPRRSATMKSR